MRQSACLVFNPIMVDNYAAFFNCTPVGRASDSMMAPSQKGDPTCKAKFDEYTSTTFEIPDADGVDSKGGVVSENENGEMEK